MQATIPHHDFTRTESLRGAGSRLVKGADVVRAPGCQLGQGVRRLRRECRNLYPLRHPLEWLGEHGFLGAEVAEERHFVYSCLLGDPAGRCSAGTHLGEDPHRGLKNRFVCVHATSISM